MQGVTVCAGLSLILLVCLTSAYFATGEKGEPMCDRAEGDGMEQDCDSHSENSDMPDDESMSQGSEGKQQVDEMPAVHHSKNIRGTLAAGVRGFKSLFSRTDPDDLYVASMLLSGVGDALGYRKGRWEFNTDGSIIHRELEDLGGLEKLHLTKNKWPVSDDTVMHLATGEALVLFGNETDKVNLYKILAKKYVECMEDMEGRAAGPTSMQGTGYLKAHKTYKLPFNPRGGGCGGAMRAMCIGLRYPREEDLDDLIAVSVESGRLTHHAPTGYLGSLAAALFTSYALQRKPIVSWGRQLVNEVLPKAKTYIINEKRDKDENVKAWPYFEQKWKEYLEERRISGAETEPYFEPNYDVKARDRFYKKYSFNGWGGASGHDAPMIAYDALLGSNDSWSELCLRGMLHGGDSDSTGTIAAAWFGALYGLKGVPEGHYKDLEYRSRLEKLGKDIHQLVSGNAP
jgi:ADP-ribosylarginine hydrolase